MWDGRAKEPCTAEKKWPDGLDVMGVMGTSCVPCVCVMVLGVACGAIVVTVLAVVTVTPGVARAILVSVSVDANVDVDVLGAWLVILVMCLAVNGATAVDEMVVDVTLDNLDVESLDKALVETLDDVMAALE